MPSPRSLAVLAGAGAGLVLALALVSVGEPVRGQAIVQEVAAPLSLTDAPEVEPEYVPLALRLPTSNDGLFRGDYAGFFQAQPRTFPGLRAEGWMGGQYGIVRTPARTPVGQTFTRLHQGIDIRPVYRNRHGEPLDTVRAIDRGTVVYVNNAANASNFGRYVVVRHDWEGASMYSLSAHLASVWVHRGTRVEAGQALGRMGYTGRGIDRQRAHLHFEIGMLLNTQYQRWHDAFHSSRNPHGIYIGRNLRGIDVTGLFTALQQNRWLSFTDFMRSQPVAYRIALPGERPLEILERHPWLGAEGVTAADVGRNGSWVISFTREGVPVRIERRRATVSQPTVVYVAREVRARHLSTAGILARSGDTYRLTRQGLGYMALLATSPAGVPRWF